MDHPVICTIIAKNYLAQARTLCDSFLSHHPGGHCYVLVIDEHAGFIDPAAERFVLVTLADIPLPERLDRFCFKYDITELATAVKPFFLRWLLESRSEPAVLYLDPDILVTAPLSALYSRLLAGPGVLLTPHIEADFPADGLLPDDRHIMLSGMFNLGFLGLRHNEATMQTFLPWIEQKLADGCVADHAGGVFVDQKYFDLVPFLFPAGCDVERGSGYNVAYWNLHSRTLSPGPAGDDATPWLCNGEPLCFFHFSGYKPDCPEKISGHQNRIRLEDRADLAPIFEHYRAELFRHGYEQVHRWPYGYENFRGGQLITYSIRRYYRRWKLAFPDTDPFTSAYLRSMTILLKASSRVSRLAGLLPPT